MRFFWSFLLCCAMFSPVSWADAPKAAAAALKPVKITAVESLGPVFKRKSAAHENGADGPTTDVSLLKSRDGRFEAGLYSAGPSDAPIESYEEDEFMFFLEGSVTLTSADGTVLEVRAGEGAAIPKGWKGRWTTPGYKKYYVTYASGPKAK
ncbi:MAG: cupin domain-containing protein [Pseudomonadota bacterium]|nr:cupin domain-containing protein [Pseudomonadota bacterium]